jgi:hypothetical protein
VTELRVRDLNEIMKEQREKSILKFSDGGVVHSGRCSLFGILKVDIVFQKLGLFPFPGERGG